MRTGTAAADVHDNKGGLFKNPKSQVQVERSIDFDFHTQKLLVLKRFSRNNFHALHTFFSSGEPERLLGKWRVGDHRRSRIQARHQEEGENVALERANSEEQGAL